MKTNKANRPPLFLKGILEVMFILLIVGLVAGAVTTVYLLLFQREEISFNVLEYTIDYMDPLTVSLVVFQVLLKALFAYLIYLFRNLIREFSKDEMYNQYQIDLIRKIGRLIIGLSIGKALLGFLAGLILGDSAKVDLQVEFLDSFWFTLALGLFFVYLSKIFENAKILKEENELTV